MSSRSLSLMGPPRSVHAGSRTASKAAPHPPATSLMLRILEEEWRLPLLLSSLAVSVSCLTAVSFQQVFGQCAPAWGELSRGTIQIRPELLHSITDITRL